MNTLNWRSASRDLILLNRLRDMLEVGHRINIMDLQFAGYEMRYPDDDKPLYSLEIAAKYTYVKKVIYGRFDPTRYRVRKFAVEFKTGNIYAVSRSGRPDRRRQYGTLDTLEDWSWREDKPKLRAFCS